MAMKVMTMVTRNLRVLLQVVPGLSIIGQHNLSPVWELVLVLEMLKRLSQKRRRRTTPGERRLSSKKKRVRLTKMNKIL